MRTELIQWSQSHFRHAVSSFNCKIPSQSRLSIYKGFVQSLAYSWLELFIVTVRSNKKSYRILSGTAAWH